jgi:hypothetical protein
VDLPESTEDLDLTLRHVARQFPDYLARALLPPGTPITGARWSDTQVTSRQRRLDRAIEVFIGDEMHLEHIEMQFEMAADVPFRIYEYNTLLSFALVAETPAGKEVPRVRSTLVLLSGREKPWPPRGEYRNSPDGDEFSGVRYKMEAVYQQTVAEIEARGPLWMVFAPLAVDADPEQMKAVLEKLRSETTPRQFTELAVALTVVADKDKRQRGLRSAIVSLLSEEIVMESWVFSQGRQKGKLEGKLEGKIEEQQEMLARFYQKRLGRGLTEDERAVLFGRILTLGVDRLDDVLFDLSPEALAAWLHDPDAR